MEYLNQLGFWAFLSLIPFILIYLIKPKPRDEKVPSLMFFMKETGSIQKRSFLRRLLTNLIFFLQLFAICGLAYSLAQPIIEMTIDTVSKNTVIVLDTSASMNAKGPINSRFDKALDFAKDSVKGTTGVILVQSKPLLILQDASSPKAVSTLNGLDAKDTTTNLGDGILLAKDILNGRDGRVVVISDFISTDGPDPQVAKRLLETEGATVNFIQVNQGSSNIGFINAEITKFNTKAYIKNFNDEQKEITFELFEGEKSIKKFKRTFLPRSVETLEFETPNGKSKLEITDNDDLAADDILYMSGPSDKKISVLLITNNRNNYLVNALTSSNQIELKISEPPIFPNFNDFDVIILQDVDPDLVTKVEIRKISESVKKGKSFIIGAQSSLAQIDFLDMVVVSPIEQIDSETTVSRNILNQITKDVDFGIVDKYLRVEPVDNSTLILASASDSSPMVALRDHGYGKIIYYGLYDAQGSFRHSPYYPIFWNQLIEFLLGSENINNFNLKTGQVIDFGESKDVKAPSGSYQTGRLIFDDAGFYEIDSKSYAANLLDEKESDIAKKSDIEATMLEDAHLDPVKKKEKFELEIIFVIFVFAILLFELYYMKYMGEI